MHEGIDDLANEPLITEGEQPKPNSGLQRSSMALARHAINNAAEKMGSPVTPVKAPEGMRLKYASVVLEDASRRELAKMVKPVFKQDDGEDWGHHVTLAYAPSDRLTEAFHEWFEEGRMVTIQILKEYTSEEVGIQAVGVALFVKKDGKVQRVPPSEFSGKFFHISISAKTGVGPKMSNALPSASDTEVREVKGVLAGTVQTDYGMVKPLPDRSEFAPRKRRLNEEIDFKPKKGGIMERYAKTSIDTDLYAKIHVGVDQAVDQAVDQVVAEAKDTHGDASGQEWIGIDLDGTLAEYNGWKGADHIGKPIKPMIDRVKAMDMPVKIMTARVAPGKADSAECRKHVEAWVKEHLGDGIEVTHEKDHLMKELWDDRAVQVEPNTGLHVLVALARELGVSLDYNEDIKAFAKDLKEALDAQS